MTIFIPIVVKNKMPTATAALRSLLLFIRRFVRPQEDGASSATIRNMIASTARKILRSESVKGGGSMICSSSF